MARILVIDDNPTFRSFLRLVLERAGHQVAEAAEGDEGLQAHRDRPADLVLCDLFMPGKEGLQTIRELREAGGVPIIAMTGDGPAYGSAMLAVAQKMGAGRALSKPIDEETLLTAVREALGK
jgi:two-component system chemotaxis response regulator CheY